MLQDVTSRSMDAATRVHKINPRKTKAIVSDPASPVVHEKQPDGIRRDLLKSVQDRLKSGFYNSDAVIDDLSSSFAGAFNQRF